MSCNDQSRAGETDVLVARLHAKLAAATAVPCDPYTTGMRKWTNAILDFMAEEQLPLIDAFWVLDWARAWAAVSFSPLALPGDETLSATARVQTLLNNPL